MRALPFVVFFIAAAAMAQGALGLEVKLVANTDRCIYHPEMGKDFCYSTYEISGLVAYEPQKTAFRFKTDKNSTFFDHVSGLEYTLTAKKEGSKTLLNITAWKMPWDSVDNVLCYEGFCFYEYSWWNASRPYHIRIDFNVSDGASLSNIPMYLGNLSYNTTFNSSCNGNFSDVWFYNNMSDGATLVPYCSGKDCIADDSVNLSMTQCVINQSCQFWVLAPHINGSVYMSWGDPAALNYSSPSVFQFIDNFDDASINATNWPTCEASFVEVATYMNLTQTGAGAKYCTSGYNVTWGQIAETYMEASNNLAHDYYPLKMGALIPDSPTIYFVGGSDARFTYVGVSSITIAPWAANSHYALKMYVRLNTTGNSYAMLNGTKAWATINYTVENGGVALNGYESGVREKWEWIRVRNYYWPEPTVSFGSLFWDWNGTAPATPSIGNETNISVRFCFDSDYLYVKEPCTDGCTSFKSYFIWCQYGCENATFMSLFEPGCKESPAMLMIIAGIILVVALLIIGKVMK